MYIQRPQSHCRVCTYACNNSVWRTRPARRVESMTSCQSWNGNLAAKRGTSQLPATANNLGRSRSSACIYLYHDDNRKSPLDRRGLYFRGGNIMPPRALFPRLLFRIPAKLLTLTIKTICASHLGVIETA